MWRAATWCWPITGHHPATRRCMPEVVPAQGSLFVRACSAVALPSRALRRGAGSDRGRPLRFAPGCPALRCPWSAYLITARHGPVQRHLLHSDRFAAEFVVETEETATRLSAFGDGSLGRSPTPDDRLTATYRVGNGRAGNVGAGAIATWSPRRPRHHRRCRNPLPAAGWHRPGANRAGAPLCAPGVPHAGSAP